MSRDRAVDAGPNADLSSTIEVDDSSDVSDEFYRRGWTDGLPMVAPTVGRVALHVAAVGREAGEAVGRVPPKWGEATIEKIAINSVMAGCLPEYMPVVVTAVEAMLVDQFNLFGVQATTHPCATAAIVSGPVGLEVGLNGSYGAFGPGWRANSSIGRAIRLVLLNLGGASPGVMDRSTQGSAAKFSFCFRELEESSPWPPFVADRGFGAGESVVTVAALEPPHNINDHGGYRAIHILDTIAGTMIGAGSNCMYLGVADSYLFLGPEHAAQIAADGYSRADIKQYLFEHARTPTKFLGAGQLAYLRKRHRANPRYLELGLDKPRLSTIPVLSGPDDLEIVVVGGAGKHSSWAPGTGIISRSVSRRVPGA